MKIYNVVIDEFNKSNLGVPKIEPLIEGVNTLGVDPLTEPLALTEAVFLSMLEIPTYSSVALLLDLRLAIYYADTNWNVGVLICRDILQLQRNYTYPVSFSSPKVYQIGDCRVSEMDNHYILSIDRILSITCRSLGFFAGNVREIDENDSKTSSELNRDILWDRQIDLQAYSYLN